MFHIKIFDIMKWQNALNTNQMSIVFNITIYHFPIKLNAFLIVIVSQTYPEGQTNYGFFGNSERLDMRRILEFSVVISTTSSSSLLFTGLPAIRSWDGAFRVILMHISEHLIVRLVRLQPGNRVFDKENRK